jgi:acetyltransferase-like isoleucine patch superfamily enzyme
MLSNSVNSDMPDNESISYQSDKDIFQRMKDGEPIRLDDPQYDKVQEVVSRTIRLSASLNTSIDIHQTRERLGELLQTELDESTTVFTPFYTNFGRFIKLGKNVFINHACSFLDMGGITIEDHVLIGPKVNLITENHPVNAADRRALICKPIHIKRKAWIGAAATILPGVTIGENAIIAAGAVVSKDVPDNVTVAGIPARIIKSIENEI